MWLLPLVLPLLPVLSGSQNAGKRELDLLRDEGEKAALELDGKLLVTRKRKSG